MAKSDLLKALNPQQQKAVQHIDGPTLVLAGAGSGKTRVLTYRIAYILEKKLAKPHQILAVTFTNKAANEMKKRVEKLLKLPVQQLWIGTFHSISARILHHEAKHAGYQSNFTIYDTDDQEKLIKRIMGFLNINSESISPKQARNIISEAKNKLLDAKQFDAKASDFRSQTIAKIFWEYEVALKRNNAMDFDDLIIRPIEIFSTHPKILQKYQTSFRYILVDEYQDTNKAQYYWVKLLAKAHENICVVGDEDQSIYHWRGADIGNILNFEKDYKKSEVIRLEQNYRSTQTILDAANTVVSNNINRLGKNLWSKKGKGDRLTLKETPDEIGEAAAVAEIVQSESINRKLSFNDMVILYRTNAQSRALEDQLRRRAIPYSIVGGVKFFERKEIKDILAYLKILVNPNDSVSLLRIINFPSRGIGANSLKALSEYALQQDLTLYDAMFEVEDIPSLLPNIGKRIKAFADILESLRKQLNSLNAYQIADKIIQEFRLKEIYEKSENIEDEGRLENVNELLNSLEIFVSTQQENDDLSNYLDEVSLLTDIDRWDPDKPSVTLMTLHSAKGLEFPVVMITGLEDGLLPLSRNSADPDDLEEERRLFYVGMTRAKEKLYLCHAHTRHRFGKDDFGLNFRTIPSRFLREIPEEFLQRSTVKSYPDFKRRRRLALEKEFGDLGPTGQMPDEKSLFKIGQYVNHEVFGRGQVLGVDQSTLGTKLTIQFDNLEIKKVIAEYANLTIADNLE